MMKKLIVTAATVATTAVAASLLVSAPAASAAPTPNPGDSCGAGSASVTSAKYGPLTCDMQAGTWVSGSLRTHVAVGGACSPAGDVRLGQGEDLAKCVGGVWTAH